MLFTIIVLIGLSAGAIIQLFRSPENNSEKKQKQKIISYLDSLAEVNKSSYTGSDLRGNAFAELSSGDTLLEKNTFFGGAPKKELPDSPVNINTASLTELMNLPGVGKKTAEKIIEYRDRRHFARTADLMNVTGIGEKKFAKLKDYIRVK